MNSIRQATISVLVLALVGLAGCGGVSIEIRNPVGIGQMPSGKTAVLKVTARGVGIPKHAGIAGGIVEVPNVPAHFAKLAAHFASETCDMDALSPAQVNQMLEAAGLEPTLQPDEKQLYDFASTLGCESYMTAHVEAWHYSYFLFWSKATITFVISYYVPGTPEPLWEARVHCARWGVDYRDVAIYTLEEMFQTVNRYRREPTGTAR